MISDAQALAATPPRGFLRMYLRYAGGMTDAPLAYHLGVGLAIMAAAAPSDLSFRIGNEVYGTMWSLIVGPSGRTRKTTCISLGNEILALALPHRLGEQPGSTEVLTDSIVAQPQQLICYPEFGDFLAKTSIRGSYLGPLREKFTELWDAKVAGRKLVHREVSVENPRLSLLGGVTPGFLEEHTRATDWRDGFMSRFFTVLADRDPARRTALPSKAHAYLQPQLVARLQRISGAPAGLCLGFNPEARVLWEKWYDDLGTRFEGGVMSWAAGAVERVPVSALKIAMLCAADFGEAGAGRAWHIGMDETRCGIALAELHLASVIGIVQNLAGSVYGRTRQTVLEAVGDGQRTRGEILAQCNPKVPLRDVQSVLDALIEEKEVYTHLGAGGSALYSRRPFVFAETFLGGTPGVTEESAAEASNVIALRPRQAMALPSSAVAPAPSSVDEAELEALKRAHAASTSSGERFAASAAMMTPSLSAASAMAPSVQGASSASAFPAPSMDDGPEPGGWYEPDEG